jgi:hypothetical protein
MLEWNGIDTVRRHERMSGSLGPVNIEFFFEKFIDGGIQIKRKPGRPIHAEAPVEIETAGAFEEHGELRPAQPKRLTVFWVV